MPPLRQHFDAGGICFSFSAPGGGAKGHSAGGEGGAERAGAWASRVKGGYGGYFGGPRDLALGGWGNYGRDRPTAVDGDELSRLTEPEEEHPDDGDGSPVLWGAPRPQRLIPVCPGSQAQLMAKYRQEMMELVKGAPEAAYELSLRDLVEVQRTAAQEEKGGVVRGETGASAGRGRGKVKGASKKKMLRSTSMDSGVFQLRMFFPASLGGRRTAPGFAGSTDSRVSPRPSPADVKKGRQERKVDAELSDEPDELGRSGRQRRKWIGCFPFLINKKSDDGEGKKHTCPCRL